MAIHAGGRVLDDLTLADMAASHGWSTISPASARVPPDCLPAVFAAGDVRHGSVERVAGAVGEGSVAVGSVHRYLAELAGSMLAQR